MHHALFVPIFGELADPAIVTRLAGDAEAAGWDGLFVWDHVAYTGVADVGEPWITLAGAAAVTERLRLGPMVTPVPRRRPFNVAREVAALDRLSGGHVTFGVGIGGDPHRELSGTGEEEGSRAGVLLDEALDVVAATWAGGIVTHRGERYVVDGLPGSRPVQRPRPPIWVGVRHGNPAPLRRAARYEGVFPVQVRDPDQLAEVAAAVGALRPAGAGPFDVAMAGVAGVDPRPYAAAGATWWLTSFSPLEVTAGEVRAALEAGPPR